jgi:hypothetical protein
MASFTDDFNRANGAPGADWDTLIGGMTIVSNALVADSTAYSYAVCDQAAATDNLRVATTVTDGVDAMDQFCRLGDAAANYDMVQAKWSAGGALSFSYTKDGVDTDGLIVAPGTTSWVATDVLETQAFNGVYTAMKNSAPVISWQDPGNVLYANVNSTHRLGGFAFTNAVANKGANSYTIADITIPAWTAPTVVSTASSTLTASRSPTVTFPTSWIPAADDVVILAPSSTALTATITAPGGWTNVLGGTTDVRSDVHQLCAVAYPVSSSDASGVVRTYTATNLYSVAQTGNTVGIVVRGADVANLIDSSNTSSNVNNTTAHVIPSLTGSNLSTDSLAVGIVVKRATGTYTLSNGWQVLASSNTNMGKVVCSYGLPMVAGTNLAAGTATASATAEYCSITLALSKAAGVTAPIFVQETWTALQRASLW